MYSHVWLRWWKKCALFSRSVLTKLYVNPTKPSLIISQDKFSLPSVATGPSMSQWVTTEMGFFLMEDKFMHGIKNINQKIIYRVKNHVAQWHCLVLSWKKTWVWISPPTCKGKKKQHLWIHSFSFEFKFFFVSVIWVFIDFYADHQLMLFALFEVAWKRWQKMDRVWCFYQGYIGISLQLLQCPLNLVLLWWPKYMIASLLIEKLWRVQ